MAYFEWKGAPSAVLLRPLQRKFLLLVLPGRDLREPTRHPESFGRWTIFLAG